MIDSMRNSEFGIILHLKEVKNYERSFTYKER